MSAIRPPLPSPLFPTQSPPSPARASRSDFFRAALDGVSPTATAVQTVAETPVRAVRSQTPSDAPEVFTRPGTYLDIRV